MSEVMSKQDGNKLRWSYFGYFAVLALIMPYLAVFLDALGFKSREIGELIAISTLCRIVGPPLWATYCDYKGKRLPAIRVGVFTTFALFFALNQVTSFAGVALVMALISFFWSAILPQLEVVTLNTLGNEQHKYSGIRAAGSMGFIVVALVAAWLIDWGGKTSFPLLAAFLMIPLMVSVVRLKEVRQIAQQVVEGASASLLQNILKRQFLSFMAASILLQLSFAPFYAFFALYLTQLGYSPFAIGAIIAVGVVAEVVMFLVASKLLVRFRLSRVLAFCMAFTALRWWLVADFGATLWLLVFSQLLHAFSFALQHSAAMRFLHRHFPKSQQSRGQAIYISVAWGGGAAIGAWVSGITWQDGAGASFTYSLAAIAALIGMVCALGIARDKQPQ